MDSKLLPSVNYVPTISLLKSHEESIVKNYNMPKDLVDNYDYCIVLPISAGENTFTGDGRHYLSKLQSYGLELYSFIGLNKTEILVLIKVPLDTLRNFAERINFKMLLDANEIESAGKLSDPERNIAGFEIAHRPDITFYHPYQFIYARYTRNVPESFYARTDGMNHPFSDLVRLKLTALMVEARPVGGGEPLKMRRYILLGNVLAFFPLHNRNSRKLLKEKWNRLTWVPWDIELLPDIRDYLGEKIALYFAFLGHYTKWILFPAFAGIPLQIAVFVLQDYSAPFLPVYSFAISIWAIIMLEFWKRQEACYTMEWGMLNYGETEQNRPDFRGHSITSFIDGRQMKYFPDKDRQQNVILSLLAVFGMSVLVLGVVVSIYVIRFTLVGSGQTSAADAQTLVSVLNAIQIQVMNIFYSFIAKALTDWENYRTETEYEDSMITKIFVFQFINSYASFFYLAFVAETFGECTRQTCMMGLAQNLGIIFGSRLATNIILGNVIPFLMFKLNFRKLQKSAGGLIVRPEKEYLLNSYDPMMSSLESYTNLAIQYGYTALFITALPLASTCGLLSNILEAKGEAWRLLNSTRRPTPTATEDIGRWQSIFLLLSIIAVVTNAGITCFTMTVFDFLPLSSKLIIFIGFQWFCFTLQFVLMESIPDIAEEVEIQRKRNNFIVSKLIDKVSDEPKQQENSSDSDAPLVLHEYPNREGNSLIKQRSTKNLF